MLKIHEINTFEGFVELQDYWNVLLRKSKSDIAALTWEHTFVSAKNLDVNQTLKILYITSEDRIIAIAPLRICQHSLKNIRYNVLEPLDFGSATDYTGLILAEQELECLKKFISYLYEQKDWNFLNISNIPEDSAFIKLVISNRIFFSKFTVEKNDICPYIQLPNSTEEFLSNLKPHFRKQLRRSLRNLKKDYGNVELRESQELGSIENAMRIFFDLHQERWNSKGTSGAFHSPKVRKLFIERARIFFEKNWLGLYFLMVNDKPVAVNYTLEYNKKISSCLTGFDPEYHRYSVSNLLLLKIVERCISRGFTQYDFMRGKESYKSKWTKDYKSNFTLKLANKQLISKLLMLGLKARDVKDDILKKFDS
jgi:hypothetical protein